MTIQYSSSMTATRLTILVNLKANPYMMCHHSTCINYAGSDTSATLLLLRHFVVLFCQCITHCSKACLHNKIRELKWLFFKASLSLKVLTFASPVMWHQRSPRYCFKLNKKSGSGAVTSCSSTRSGCLTRRFNSATDGRVYSRSFLLLNGVLLSSTSPAS